MTEVILGLIVLSLIGLQGWTFYRYQEQEKRYIKALLSKNVEEFTKSEIAEKKVPKNEPLVDDLVPMSELSDDQFDKVIKKDSGGNK